MKQVNKVEMRSELRKMTLCVYDLDLALPLDLALHVFGDGKGDNDVVFGLNDKTRKHNFVKNISIISKEHSFGQGECYLGPHSFQTVCKFLNGNWIACIHYKRSKG